MPAHPGFPLPDFDLDPDQKTEIGSSYGLISRFLAIMVPDSVAGVTKNE